MTDLEPQPTRPKPEIIDKETYLIIKEHYSVHDNPNDIALEKIKHDYETKQEVRELFSKWDTNGDGILDEHELSKLAHEYKTTDSSLRYL
jgi:Ca2+-binding EF-hand superfamily protein